jgi:hypothetical protein
MREPEMVGRDAGAVTSRGGRAVAGRYPTALTVDGFAPMIGIGGHLAVPPLPHHPACLIIT